MVRYKRLIVFTLLFGIYSPSLVASALTTVTGYKSLNNSSSSDYKTSEEDIINTINNMSRPSDYKEVLNYNDSKRVIDSNTELSYLLDNNILGSDIDISYDRTKSKNAIKTDEVKKFDYDNNSRISKSDFLATLTKAVYGVQESRYMLFQTTATREVNGKEKSMYISSEYVPNGYDGEDDTFDFSKGDYNIYVTPNVYELYFKTLVNKGVVPLSEFSDLEFVNAINSYGATSDGKISLPMWDTSLKYYNVSSSNYNNNVNIVGNKPLGSGFTLEETNTSANVKSKRNSWFFNESLITIDALRYIEKSLRVSEKDMTKTEAELVNYKYGAMYLERLDPSTKDTIMFLVAKGILNFENEEEFNNIYKDLTGSFFRTLMYRVSNKDARMEFSSIQLTDSDNYWLSRGYYSNKISFYSGTAPSFDTKVTELTQSREPSKLSNLFGFIKSREVIVADGPAEYEVKRTFANNDIQYTYKGITLSASTKPEGDITSAQLSSDKNYLTVTFKIKASNASSAVAIVDANMTIEKNSSVSIGTIPAVSEVSSGEEKITYVSQSALKNLNGLPILVVNDKYLINKENNSKALLLEDNNVAIVGNEIIKTEGNIVSGINGEVYYNFAIISKLLSQSMISSLNPNSWYLLPNSGSEVNYKFVSGKGSELEDIYVNSFKRSSISTGTSSDKNSDLFYNITLANSTSNYLIQNISKELGYPSSCFNYMVVEFKYILPESKNLPINSNYVNDIINGEISMSDVYGNLYTRPDNTNLTSLWDSNLMMSNSIINYMMGTSGVSYVKSGYIVPKVYILSDMREPGKSYDIEAIDKLFLNNIRLPINIVNSFGSYNKEKKFVENFFNYIGTEFVTTGNSILDTIKRDRTLEVIPYKKAYDKNIGYFDFSKFVVLNTGQVFRNINSSSDLTLDSKKKTIKFSMKTGRAPTIMPLVNYKVEGNNSDIESFLSTSVSAYGLVDLVGLKPLTFSYNSDGNKDNKLVYKDGSGNLIPAKDYIGEIGTSIFNGGGLLDVTSSNFSGDVRLISDTKKGAIYYSEGKFIKISNDGSTKDLSERTDSKELNNSVIYVYPKFKISNSAYTPNSEGILVKGNNDPRFDLGNIINGGIASQIVDSIVYSNLNYTTYSELPKGAKVYIGDAMYIKSGEFLQSDVLSDTGVIAEMSTTNLVGANSAEKIKTVVSKTIGNVSLFNKSASSSTSYAGREVPLTDYIGSVKFGSGQEDSNYSNTLKLDGKGSLTVKRFLSSDVYEVGIPFDSYCIAFSLDSSIRFRSIDDTNTKFTVVRVINKNSDGFLENVPYFIESLDYNEMDGLSADIVKSLFKPSDDADELMQKFLDAYRLNTQRDLKELAKYWIRLICTVLSSFNLIILMLRRSPLDIIVRDVKYSATSKYNIDLYKIFTFGFQSVDYDMPIWKGVLVSGVLVAIASFATIGSF